MKNEAEVNAKIVKGFSKEWSYKIPDPSGSEVRRSIKRPHDGYAIFNGLPTYWEAKHRVGMGVLDISEVQPHQWESLRKIHSTLKVGHNCLIIYGVSAGRGDNRAYVFADIELMYKRYIEKNNILLKELKTLPYYKAKGDSFDFSELIIPEPEKTK